MSVFINTSCFLLNQLSATATTCWCSLSMGSVLYFVGGVFTVYDSWHYWSQVRVSSVYVVDWYATAPLCGCAESDCCRHPPCSARVALVLDGHSSLSDCYTQRFCMIWWVCRYTDLNCYALAFHSQTEWLKWSYWSTWHWMLLCLQHHLTDIYSCSLEKHILKLLYIFTIFHLPGWTTAHERKSIL